MGKFVEVKIKTAQSAEPFWSRWENGRYIESKEFRIVTFQYKVYFIKGVKVWTDMIGTIIDESKWYTPDSFAKEMGYGVE